MHVRNSLRYQVLADKKFAVTLYISQIPSILYRAILAAATSRVRAQLATAEAKAQMLEQQLQTEEQEKARLSRQASCTTFYCDSRLRLMESFRRADSRHGSWR